MLDIQNLNYIGGLKRNDSSNLAFGIGRQGGSKAWEETYDKIMKSKESLNFYFVAAQEHLDEITANDFALETNMRILQKEEKILGIIKPLSTENNEIYSKILNTLGLEAGGFGGKVKAFGGRVWVTIKEAFRKLRLAITNIIAAIRRWFASLGQGDAAKVYEKRNEITSKLSKVGNKTISVLWPPKKVSFLTKPEELIKATGSLTNNLFDNVKAELERTTGTPTQPNPGYSSKQSSMARWAQGYNASIGKALDDRLGGGSKNWMSEKGSVIKAALYGKTPKKRNVKLSEILKDNSINLLAPGVAQNMKNASNQLDLMVKNINNVLTTIEKREKTFEGDNADKSVQKHNLQQLSLLRSVVMKVAIISKDAYTEFFKLRGIVLKAAKMVLNNETPTSKKDAKKAAKAQQKEDENAYNV